MGSNPQPHWPHLDPFPRFPVSVDVRVSVLLCEAQLLDWNVKLSPLDGAVVGAEREEEGGGAAAAAAAAWALTSIKTVLSNQSAHRATIQNITHRTAAGPRSDPSTETRWSRVLLDAEPGGEEAKRDLSTAGFSPFSVCVCVLRAFLIIKCHVSSSPSPGPLRRCPVLRPRVSRTARVHVDCQCKRGKRIIGFGSLSVKRKRASRRVWRETSPSSCSLLHVAASTSIHQGTRRQLHNNNDNNKNNPCSSYLNIYIFRLVLLMWTPQQLTDGGAVNLHSWGLRFSCTPPPPPPSPARGYKTHSPVT